jgi:hypothetical protein
VRFASLLGLSGFSLSDMVSLVTQLAKNFFRRKCSADFDLSMAALRCAT